MSLPEFDGNVFKLGKLCKRGHDWNGTGQSLKKINRRACYQCEKEYTAANSEKTKARCKEWYQQNKEKHHQYTKEYIKNHPEQRLAIQARYRERNRDTLREKNREYTAKHKDRLNAKGKLDYQKPETKQRLKLYYQSQAGKLVSTRARQKYRALKRATHHWDYDKKQILMLFNKFDNRCAYCGADSKLTVDHWIALSTGGTDVISNLIPSCSICNCSKYNNPGKQWYEKQSFYTKKRWKKIEKHLGIEVVNGQIPFF